LKKNTVWPQWRFSWWIATGGAAVVLITTLLLLLVVDQFARDYTRREAAAQLRQSVGKTRDALDRDMRKRIADMAVLKRDRVQDVAGAESTAAQGGMSWSILLRRSAHLTPVDILVLEKQLVVAVVLEGVLLMVCALLLSYKLAARANKDGVVAIGWSYYEFNRLSPALGNMNKHAFASPGKDFEPKVNARIRALREIVAALSPGAPSPHLAPYRHLFE
jgi:hypothetical protein